MPPQSEQLARDFYCGIIGMTEIAKPEPIRSSGGMWLACGEFQLHLGVDENHRPSAKAHAAVVVADLSILRHALVKNDCSVEDGRQIPGCVRLFVRDPFGNLLEFLEKTGRAS